jgi:acyl dehydratase
VLAFDMSDSARTTERSAGAQLFLGDFEIGARFAAITGDNHPLHYDQQYASETRFGACIAHGLLVTSYTALGAIPLSDRLKDSMIAFIEQGSRFLAPLYVGDRIRSCLIVESIEIKSGRNNGFVRFQVKLEKEDGSTILDGFHKYLLATRPRQ